MKSLNITATGAAASDGSIPPQPAGPFTNPDARPKPQRPYVAPLDGLRCIAVIAVLVYHVRQDWLPGGFLGVDVFFVLSGYLITNGILRDRALGRFNLGRFWVRRLRRLLPALVTMVIVVSALLVAFPPDLRVGLGKQLFGAFTYTSNWVSIVTHDSYFSRDSPTVFLHLWSLAVEEQFYLVWPLLLALLVLVPRAWRRGWSFWIPLMLAVASAVAMAAAFTPGHDPSFAYFATPTHAFGLMLGAAAAAAVPIPGSFPSHASKPMVGQAVIERFAGRAGWFLALASAVAVALGFALLHDQAAPSYWGGMFGVCLATAVLITTVAAGSAGPVAGVLAWRPFLWVGRRSYSIYLWHWPVILMADELFPEPERRSADGLLVVAALALVVSVAAAAASYRWIERPVLAHGFVGALRVFRERLESLPLPGASVVMAVAGIAVVALCSVSVATAPAVTQAQSMIDAGEQFLEQQSAAPTPPSDPASGSPEPSEPPPSAPASPGAPAVMADRVPGSRMVAVGDSVMLASGPALVARFPGLHIDASVARQSGDTLGAGEQVLQDDPSAAVLIVHIGTNGEIPQGALNRMLDAVGPDRRVVLVNDFADRSWEPANNGILSAAADGRDNVAVADWHAAVQQHPDELAADGVHPNAAGMQRYADTVAGALATLPAPPGV